MASVHVAAVAAWILAWLVGLAFQRRSVAAGSPEAELARRATALRVAAVQHSLAAVALLSGVSLMVARGWRFGYPEWLAVKIGLVAFLVLPLEAMHAYVCHFWIRPGLLESRSTSFSRRLQRGLGMEEMLRALAVPLLGIAAPLLLWLSIRKPF